MFSLFGVRVDNRDIFIIVVAFIEWWPTVA